MSKPEGMPDDIPHDVWDKAYEVVGQIGTYMGAVSHHVVMERVARAILNERNNAAKIAEEYSDAIGIAGQNGEILPIAPFISQARLSEAVKVLKMVKLVLGHAEWGSPKDAEEVLQEIIDGLYPISRDFLATLGEET